MIRACTHEARGGRRDWKTETRRKTRVFVYFSRANAACVCICIWANFSLCGRPQSFHAHGSPQKLDDAFCTNRHASRSRARAHIDDTPSPPFVRLCVPLFFFLQPVTSLNSRKSRIHFCPPRSDRLCRSNFGSGEFERERKSCKSNSC